MQYVVPAETPPDLKVYISTTAGLEQVTNNNKHVNKLSDSARLNANDFTVGITNEGYISEEEKKTKPQRCTSHDRLIETKPAGKEKTTDNKPAVKPQSSKPRFSVPYHVSLNRAHQQ